MIKFDTNGLEYSKKWKSLAVTRDSFYYDGRFPAEVEITSSHTGRTIKFVRDDQAYMENEGWDGEQMEYVQVDPLPNVKKFVIYNGC